MHFGQKLVQILVVLPRSVPLSDVLERSHTYVVAIAVAVCVTVAWVTFVIVTVLPVLTVAVFCADLIPKTFEQYLDAPGDILSA